MIGNKLPCKLRDSLGSWAVHICSSSGTTNAKAARSILALAVYLRSSPNDLVLAQGMASELLIVLGSEERDPVEKSKTYPIINHSTEQAVASFLLQLIESIISDLDWAISKLKALSATSHESTDLGNSDGHEERAPGLVLEEALYSMSEVLVNLLSSFAETSLKGTIHIIMQHYHFLRLYLKVVQLYTWRENAIYCHIIISALHYKSA